MSDYVTPYVALSAESTRTEQDVIEARLVRMPVATDTLTPMLENMIRLREAYNESVKKSARFTSTDSLIERVDADVEKRIAYEAMDEAETAYNEAIKAHVKRMQEARNV